MKRRELAGLLARLCRSLSGAKDWVGCAKIVYEDVPEQDKDRGFIESMVAWGDFSPLASRFNPDAEATRATLVDWMKRLDMPVDSTLSNFGTRALTRAEAAMQLWRALRLKAEAHPGPGEWLQPGGDHDGDGRKDYDDPLPFDRDNNGILDHLQPSVVAKVGRGVLAETGAAVGEHGPR